MKERVVFWIVFFLGIVIQVFCQSGGADVIITTNSTTITGEKDGTVVLACDVQNKRTNDKVIWEFVDHNVTIATGTDIRVQDGLSKYEIYKPQDSSSELHWYLRINSLQLEDVGTYRCYVSGPDVNTNVVHHVFLKDAPERPSVPKANIMDCCREKNVSSCIYPLCDRGNYTTNDFINVLLSDNCVDDNLLRVLECGQGGRNALGCCIREGMPELCQRLCEGWGIQDGTSYVSCIATQAEAIASCYDQGLEYLPSRPTSVSAVSATKSFNASWAPPLEKADEVTKYRVSYRIKGTQHYDTRSTQDASQTSLQVNDLMADMVYEFHVIALAGQGASQPSYTVDIAVKGEISDNILTETIYDCCMTKGVSSSCIQYCSADTLRRGGNPDTLLTCFAELNNIYSCLANQGNHTPCCSREGIPSSCFPLCEGRINLNWNVSFCLPYNNLIVNCILEGSTFLPSPPYNTRIVPGSITSESVTIAWSQPDDFQEGDSYVVGWKLHRQSEVQTDWNTVSISVGTSYTITGLLPAEIYDAVVATENRNGSSLPELTLVFVTEAAGYDIQTPYNETVCCKDRGVPDECIDICNHSFRLTPQSLLLAFNCNSSVLHMLQCASDGRNHTDCCIREGVSNNCLELCSLHPEDVPSESFVSCAVYKDQLSTCFDQGKGILPNPPIGLTIKDVEEHSITLDWQIPAGPNVTSYTVQYSMKYGTWIQSKDSNETYIIIDGLMPGTTYYFRVRANNLDGTSLPSEIVVGYTVALPINPNVNGTLNWDAVWQNRSDCCSKSGVSADCQAGCNNGDVLDINQCIGDYDKIIACGADGRNHTQCCDILPDFPKACLSYCAGQVPPQDALTAHCLSYKKSIFTCFTNGEGKLPTPPSELLLGSFQHNQAAIQWTKPSNNCESGCGYTVMIRQDEKDVKSVYVEDKMSYTFFNLMSETEYRISAISNNSYGSSLPAPYIIVRTLADPYNGVTVQQSPVGSIDKGGQVKFSCITTSNTATVQWERNQKVFSKTNMFKNLDVKKEDEGVYTCVAVFAGDVTVTKDIFLNVRYEPHVESMFRDTVLPDLDQEARINCTFRGFPDVVYWTKDGTSLTESDKYMLGPVERDLETGKSVAALKIRSVTTEDYGTYACTGRSIFGNDTISGKLENPKPPVVIPPRVNTTVAECCDARGVPSSCSSQICSYTLDLNVIIYNTNLGHCLSYFEDFIACGTDGKDHSTCCKSKSVSDYCLGFCAGQLPEFESSWELVTCMVHITDISNCLVNGSNNIPTAPLSVSATVMYDEVSVTWQAPAQNADKVDKYDIYYQPSGTDQFSKESVSASSTQYDLPVAIRGVTYTVYMRAVNNFGESADSASVQVPVTKLVPRKPSMFTAEILAEINVSLVWKSPTGTNTQITGYKLIYWKGGFGRSTAAVVTLPNILRTRLTDLDENSLYNIVLVAQSVDGFGQESEVKKVVTSEVPQTATLGPENYGDDNQGKVGVAVGAVLAIIFMIAIAIAVILFYRRKFQRKHGAPVHDTVAFENPSYGNKRSGLPSENPENNQFGYSNLHEEQDVEQVHLSFGNTMSSSSTDAPATLDVSS